MRYFVPDIFLSEELPPQSAPQDKLGGQPWGLKPDHWPTCRGCGKSQTLLAQFVHDSVRLDLGKIGRVLNVFQCAHAPGMCDSWRGGSGANACFVAEPDELTTQTTPLPSDSPPVEREVRIVKWQQRDDGISEDELQKFFISDDCETPPESLTEAIYAGTKLGGVPSFVQSPNQAPTGSWRFVGQLEYAYSFLTAPLGKHRKIWPDPKHRQGRSQYCDGPNFGDGGTAYIFVRDASPSPVGWFFWQCG